MKLFKKIIVLFFIGTMFFSSYVYADDYKLHKVNFSIAGGDLLTDDVELIFHYDDDTCTSILLEKESNYKTSTVLREGEVKVEILNLTEIENLNIKYDKEININKDLNYKITVSKAAEKEEKIISPDLKDTKEKTKKNENNYKNNLLNILSKLMITAIVIAIVAAIFGIIMIRRRK